MNRQMRRGSESRDAGMPSAPPGIVIADGVQRSGGVRLPRIHAFVWGAKVRPTPTLPYGRWKGMA